VRKRERLRSHSLPSGPIVVAPHGVGPRPFHDASRHRHDDSLLAAYGIRSPFVAFTGTIEPRKGLPTLVEAFARIAGADRRLRLVLAGGEGWGSDDVRDAVAAAAFQHACCVRATCPMPRSHRSSDVPRSLRYRRRRGFA